MHSTSTVYEALRLLWAEYWRMSDAGFPEHAAHLKKLILATTKTLMQGK